MPAARMSLLDKIFGGDEGPSERQLRRAVKAVTQIHGDASPRVSALERLGNWGTPEAAAALLRRFTVQVPQGSMDLEEKQYTVQLLAKIGRPAVEPIVQFLKTEPDVTWPIQALREMVPHEEFVGIISSTLDEMGRSYTRWPEAKTVLLSILPDDAYARVRETVLRYVDDENDDICIAAVDYLARNGDESVREKMIEKFFEAESRPRVRGRILDHFCDRDWPVTGYRKRLEAEIPAPFYLTSKGFVKRREIAP
jgi:HEAT repeat protein